MKMDINKLTNDTQIPKTPNFIIGHICEQKIALVLMIRFPTENELSYSLSLSLSSPIFIF